MKKSRSRNLRKQGIEKWLHRIETLVIIFIISLVISRVFHLLGNLGISLIIGLIASEIGPNPNKFTGKEVFWGLSCLIAVETATLVRLLVLYPSGHAHGLPIIMLGIIASIVVYAVGWTVGRR